MPRATSVTREARTSLVSQYSTTFPNTEVVLSEGNVWVSRDPYGTRCAVTTAGKCHGTQVGGPNAPYDDSNAYFPWTGYSHEVEAVIYKDAGIPAVNHEVEILLSWFDGYPAWDSGLYGFTSARGYEINLQSEGLYFNLGRWKRSPGLIDSGNPGFVPQTGDILRANIRHYGTYADIDCYWKRGAAQTQFPGFPYRDTNPEPPGYPGIGYFIHSGGDNTKFGFSSVIVRSL